MTSNGELPARTLHPLVNFAPIQTGAQGTATQDTAHQWAVLAAAFEREVGKILYASEGYRSLERQQKLWLAYRNGGTLAAYPGSSNHGLGEAIDVGSGVGTKTGPEYAWMAANAHKYGFVNDVPTEGWHWHYAVTPTITTTRTVNAVTTVHAAAAIHEQEDDDMATSGYIAPDSAGNIWVCDPLAGTKYNLIANQKSVADATGTMKFYRSAGLKVLTSRQGSAAFRGLRDITNTVKGN